MKEKKMDKDNNRELDVLKQLVVAVTKSEQDAHDIRNGLQGINSIDFKLFNDPHELLSSVEFKKADVFIVSINLGNYDGRQLYLEQKNRLRIVPFLFLIDRPITDQDWDCCSVVYSKDLYDYLEKPYSSKKLRHRVNLMLTITNMYNVHTIDTIDGIRAFWRESVIKDREMLHRMREIYRKEK